jgi:hypothetical protein
MTKLNLTTALENIKDIESLETYLKSLTEGERKTLPLAPIKKFTKNYGLDITTGETGELLKDAFAYEKQRLHFEKIGNAAVMAVTWLITGVIELGAFFMVFGDSGTLKTFFAIAIAACIATGRDFYGHSVRQGAVFYIAAEGKAGLVRRFTTWAQFYGVDISNAPLYHIVNGTVDLLNAAELLHEALESAIAGEIAMPLLVVIDTWSRALTGDDSDTKSASIGLAELDKIRAKFPGLAIIIIHHTGHKEKTRARGASLIHAAVDSEYHIKKLDDGNIYLENTKSKVSELAKPMAFKPKVVELLAPDGKYLLNENLEIEKSLVLESIAYNPLRRDWELIKNGFLRR